MSTTVFRRQAPTQSTSTPPTKKPMFEQSNTPLVSPARSPLASPAKAPFSPLISSSTPRTPSTPSTPRVIQKVQLKTSYTIPSRRSSVSVIAERTALWFFRKDQVSRWFHTDPVGAVVWGYICFFAVISFLITPVATWLIASCIFGLIHSALIVAVCSAYNALEDKIHPNGLVGRHWPAFHDTIGAMWKAFARILPITVMKLAPNETYSSSRKFMFGYHPHGVLFYGPGFLNMNWNEFFPGTKCSNLMSSMVFICPLFRNFCLWTGCIPATAASARKAVTKHDSNLAVIPGGLAEMLMADPRPRTPTQVPAQPTAEPTQFDLDKDVEPEPEGKPDFIITEKEGKRKEIVLFLSQRKGFVRLAMQLGLDLVPIFTHGELELYHQMQWGLPLRLRLSRILKVPLTMVWGNKLVLPFRRPLTVVVGRPLPVEKIDFPTKEQVEEMHSKYMHALIEMFEETKEECGYGDTTLVIR